MANSEVAVIDLQLDVNEAIASSEELGKVFSELKTLLQSIGQGISKAFAPVLSSMQKIQTGVDKAAASLATLAGSVKTVNAAAEKTANSFNLVDGITAAYDGMNLLFDKIKESEDFSEKLKPFFEELVTSPNVEKFLTTILPKTSDTVSTISGWFDFNIVEPFEKLFESSGVTVGGSATTLLSSITSAFGGISTVISTAFSSVMPTITGVFQGISAAFSGMSLGWGAVIAGIVALIVLLVTNWDTVKAAVVSAWETVMGALSTAAEWLNTTVIQPIVGFVTGLWESVSGTVSQIWEGVVSVFSTAAQWIYDNVLKPVLDFFAPIVEWYSQLFQSIWQTVSDVFYNIGVIISGCWEVLVAVWGAVSEWFSTNVIQPVAEFFGGLWNSISSWAVNAWNDIVAVFTGIAVWFYQNVTQPMTEFFTGLWEGFANAAKQAWEGVKSVFSKVTGFFKDIFSKAWAGIVSVFSAAGEIFTDIKDGILSAFKNIVNGIIKGLNSAISVPFNGINSAIGFIRDITILGITPFSGLKTFSVPQIPYLAKGAVLPANRPFLAMVGDQRHGTNVEAPLATIQQAVAVELDSRLMAMMGVFQELLREQRATRQTIEGIELGDRVIGQAAARYQQKMAVVRGSAY